MAVCALGACEPEGTEQPVLSSDANLSTLTITGITLTPAFTPSTTSYSGAAGNSIVSVLVTARPADQRARVTVNGTQVSNTGTAPALPLAIGPNTITILVTAENGTSSRTYTVLVTRTPGMPAARPGLP